MTCAATHNRHQVVNAAFAILRRVCAQCMATAVTAGAAATGVRAWLATRSYAWLTPTRLRRATGAVIVVAVAAAGTGFG